MQRIRLLVLLLCLFPLLAQGAEELVTLDDSTELKVFVFHPADQGDGPWPLGVLFPGGKANEYVARAQFWLGKKLTERGWVIAVPVSPDTTGFFDSNAEKIPQVISHLQESPRIRNGKSLLLGVSNGGSSALEIGTRQPENYFGVVAVPGIIKNSYSIEDLQELPVFIRIGEKDFLGWDKRLGPMRDRLEEAGADVDARLLPGASHIFPLNWNELDPWLQDLQ